MDPVSLLSLSYKGVTVANALVQIRQRYDIAAEMQSSLEDINSTLRGIENLLKIQISQPLKSGLSMLADAEAEYSVDVTTAQEPAQSALMSFNQAEGQLADVDNQLVAVAGKACAYKLLGKIGAYNHAAISANKLCENALDNKTKEKIRKSLLHLRSQSYIVFQFNKSSITFKGRSYNTSFLEWYLRQRIGDKHYERAEKRGFLDEVGKKALGKKLYKKVKNTPRNAITCLPYTWDII